MRNSQLHSRHNATGNGLTRTCSLADLKAFQAYYKKSNADCDYAGEVEVFWTDSKYRLKVSHFFGTYLSDLMREGADAKNGYYEFGSSNSQLFKQYLDAAKNIDTTNIPTYTTNPGGEYYQANSYWRVPIPFSKAKQQEELDGQNTALAIETKKLKIATAKEQTATAELNAYNAEEKLNSAKGSTTRWILIACAALAGIVILKRTKKK